jgi:hypothetical protein
MHSLGMILKWRKYGTMLRVATFPITLFQSFFFVYTFVVSSPPLSIFLFPFLSHPLSLFLSLPLSTLPQMSFTFHSNLFFNIFFHPLPCLVIRGRKEENVFFVLLHHLFVGLLTAPFRLFVSAIISITPQQPECEVQVLKNA